MYGQPFTLAQIQAREADIRALADLSRTLDKKVIIISLCVMFNRAVMKLQFFQ